MQTEKINNNLFSRLLFRMVKHWSPSITVSIVVNALLLYVFAWLLTVDEYKAPDKSSIKVYLVQKAEPVPEKTLVQKPKKPKKPEKAKKPKPPVKKVQKSKPQTKPVEKVEREVDPSPVVEQIQEPPVTETEKNVPNEVPAVSQPPVSEKAQAQKTQVTPLFRLTRMPKVIDYDLEALKRFYPEDEKGFGREATVETMIVVDENGSVVDVEIIKSAGQNFDSAAKKALLSKVVVLQPGYIGGKAVTSRVPIEITFKID